MKQIPGNCFTFQKWYNLNITFVKGGSVLKKIVKALVLVLAFTLVFSLAGCSSKSAITADKFESIMEDEDYDVSDIDGDEIDEDYDIDEARYATLQDEYVPYAMFIDFDSLSDAKDFFSESVDDAKNMIDDENLDATTTSKSSGDYQKFTAKGEDEYGGDAYTVMIRVKNTVLFVYTDGDSKSDVKDVDGIVSKLGY
jgi:hypothetical protein